MNKERNYYMYLVAVAVTAVSLTFLVMFPFTQGGAQKSGGPNMSLTLPDSVNYIMRNFQRGLDVEGTALNDVPLYTLNRNTSLHKLVKEPTLVFRFFETNCEPCICAEVMALQNSMNDLHDKVLLIGSYATYKGMRAFLTANKLDSLSAYRISPLDTLRWEPEKYESPYYFVLYPDGRASQFFMAVPDYIGYTKQYIEGVRRVLE